MQFLTLAEAVQRFVPDGACVALEGFTHLIPFAAGHEIIRQKRRDLHLIRMTPDLIYDQMIGMGCARRLTFSWGGNPGVGLAAPPARCGGEGLAAAARDRRAQPCRNGRCLQRRRRRAAVRRAARLYRHGSSRAQRSHPHGALSLHRRRAGDGAGAQPGRHHPACAACGPKGNVAISGIVGAQREAALAAKTLIVTVEEIVEELAAGAQRRAAAPLADRGRRALPGWCVSLLCAWVLRTRQRVLSAMGRARARPRPLSTNGWNAMCSARATIASSSRACGRQRHERLHAR